MPSIEKLELDLAKLAEFKQLVSYPEYDKFLVRIELDLKNRKAMLIKQAKLARLMQAYD